MGPLLEKLKLEGVALNLELRVKGDLSDGTRALIRDNRDCLLEHLAHKHVGAANASQPSRLTLYGDLLYNLMVWCAQYQELRIEHSAGLVLDAKPEHVRDAVVRHPWGLVYDIDRRVLVSWGYVPAYVCSDKKFP